VVSLGSYLLGAAQLAVIALSLGFSAFRLRRWLMPSWEGPPARLVETIVAVSLLIWISEILGTFTLFYAGTLVAACALLALAIAFSPAGGGGAGVPRGAEARPAPSTVGDAAPTGPAGQSGWQLLIMVGVVALVFGHWALTTKHALDRGVFNFDSLWYHLPFAADMAQSHSVTGMHHVDTVFTNWFYPQNSELLHAVGMLTTGRDTLSLFINYGWLVVAFLAAWCVGRPYGRGSLSVIAAAIVLECHTLVVREPGAAKNDLMAAALLLAAIAILVNTWSARRSSAHRPVVPLAPDTSQGNRGTGVGSHVVPSARQALQRNHAAGLGWLSVGWPLAVAGLAVGLAAGTKVTALAMAAALSVAVLVLAPAGRRWAAAGWWFVPALLGGGFWYLRNLVVAGNPEPAIEHLGPISLPHPERLQIGRPDFSIAHYATDTGVWRHYFFPGLHDAFGALWPLVIGGAVLAALLAVLKGRDRVVRWMGAVALFGFVAYIFTPLSAAGAEGAPEAFGINVRYIYGALLAGLVLAPLPRFFDDRRRQWWLLGGLLLVLLLSDRADAVLRDPGRLFALLVIVLAVLVPAALLLAHGRGASRGVVIGGAVALALAVLAIGYPLQRHYLDERFRNEVAAESIPGMHLDSAYRWARNTSDARIGLAGTTAGFGQYGFFGTDLSNRVIYLGVEGPHGSFNAIPTCRAFRAAVNTADLDYLVTAPFLNFIHPDRPIASPEASWLRGEAALAPLLRSGPVTVWKVRGRLDPGACGSRNAPLREIPDTPAG
jgi:predicted membrane channel-forming protein YqfA (hemolysin III family)